MIQTGDCIEVMAAMDADSVDAIVTDPPYGLEFMGKEWDGPKSWDSRTRDEQREKSGRTRGGYIGLPERAPIKYVAGHSFQVWCEAWGREALRVTKPGGYLLAFGGTRTHHRLVCGLEDAGWIIRDELDWIYASGFPKGKANLKPAHEPIVLARKPGPLRPLAIDECRIPGGGDSGWHQSGRPAHAEDSATWKMREEQEVEANPAGRWPSNLLLSDPALFDEPNPYVVGSGATVQSPATYQRAEGSKHGGMFYDHPNHDANGSLGYGDSGGYSRFFTIPQSGTMCEWCGVSIAGPSSAQPSPPAASAPSGVPTSADGTPAPTGNGVSATTTEPTESEYWHGENRSTPSTPSGKRRGTSPRSTSSSGPANGAVLSGTSSDTTTTTPSRWLCGSCAGLAIAASTLDVSLIGWPDSPAARGTYPKHLIVPKADRADREPVLRGQLTATNGNAAEYAQAAAWQCVCGAKYPGGMKACPKCGSDEREFYRAAVGVRENAHPTVKPVDLMRHLVRLVTPQGGTVLDCFLGSGSTAIAAELEGFPWLGIEKEPEYVAIAEARLNGTQRGLGLDVPAPTQRRERIGQKGPDQTAETRDPWHRWVEDGRKPEEMA